MILVLFGQPHSGKTTLSKEIGKKGFDFFIDGDDLREIFSNKDYSREGRIKNLNRASEIATFLSKKGRNVILSLVYPIKECRDYLSSLNNGDVFWVYLTYRGIRGREANHVIDFDIPEKNENCLCLDTTELSVDGCVNQIIEFYDSRK